MHNTNGKIHLKSVEEHVEIPPVLRTRIIEAAGLTEELIGGPEAFENYIQMAYQTSITGYRTYDEVLSEILMKYLTGSDLEELQKIVEFPTQWIGIRTGGDSRPIVLVGSTKDKDNTITLDHLKSIAGDLLESKSIVLITIMSLWDVIREIRNTCSMPYDMLNLFLMGDIVSISRTRLL